MLSNFFGKAQCLVGAHKGTWEFASEDSCEEVRICERCNEKSVRTTHAFLPWAFVDEGTCNQQRTCQRCRTVEEQVSHSWGKRVFLKEGECTTGNVCARCGETQSPRVEHRFETWKYVKPDACLQAAFCSRCGEEGSQTRVEHDWGDWQYSDTHKATIRVCRRDGEILVKEEAAKAADEPPTSSV